MSNYQQEKASVFLRFGTGSSDLASEIIKLEEENEKLLRLLKGMGWKK